MKLYSVREAAKQIGITRSYAYLLIQMRRLKAQRIGAQFVISDKEIERFKETKN